MKKMLAIIAVVALAGLAHGADVVITNDQTLVTFTNELEQCVSVSQFTMLELPRVVEWNTAWWVCRIRVGIDTSALTMPEWTRNYTYSNGYTEMDVYVQDSAVQTYGRETAFKARLQNLANEIQGQLNP